MNPRLKLIKAGPNDTVIRSLGPDYKKIDFAARLPAGMVWKRGVPLVPIRPDAEPPTLEKIKNWLDEDE